MRSGPVRFCVAAAIGVLVLANWTTTASSKGGTKAPNFPTADPRFWIGPPQTWDTLKDKVVILDVWTFMCINCQRTIPWIHEMDKRFSGRGLTIVGIHTPELDEERPRGAVEAAVKENGLQGHSHLLDNDMRFWESLGNEYWPAIYVVDKCRRIQRVVAGEVHVATSRDKEISSLVERLLSETPDCSAK